MKNLISICIPTYNRAKFLSDTLNNLIQEIGTLNIPIIISDNASTDNTQEIVNSFKINYAFISYHRNNSNEGIDNNIIKCVSLARSKYVWLFGDDDLISKNAIKKIQSTIAKNYDLIVINSSTNNIDFSKEIEERRLKIYKNKFYKAPEFVNFFYDTALYSTFIGSIIIKKKIWDLSDYKQFLNTDFVHTGIIYSFLNYKNCFFISEPLIRIRLGNASWSSRYFEVWMVNFPKVIWSLPKYLLEKANKYVTKRYPFNNVKTLITLRASYRFSYKDFKKFIQFNTNSNIIIKFISLIISIIPSKFLNCIFEFYFYLKKYRISDFENMYFKFKHGKKNK